MTDGDARQQRSADSRLIGQEVVFRVGSTGGGVRVARYDGRGLADGIMGKRILRYFYGDDAEEKATEYARKKARGVGDEGKVALLGERFKDRHPPQDGGADE